MLTAERVGSGVGSVAERVGEEAEMPLRLDEMLPHYVYLVAARL